MNSRSAVLETDRVSLKEKVLQAETAVSLRLSELVNIPNSVQGTMKGKGV